MTTFEVPENELPSIQTPMTADFIEHRRNSQRGNRSLREMDYKWRLDMTAGTPQLVIFFC
jgi:hypothetical protein